MTTAATFICAIMDITYNRRMDGKVDGAGKINGFDQRKGINFNAD